MIVHPEPVLPREPFGLHIVEPALVIARHKLGRCQRVAGADHPVAHVSAVVGDRRDRATEAVTVERADRTERIDQTVSNRLGLLPDGDRRHVTPPTLLLQFGCVHAVEPQRPAAVQPEGVAIVRFAVECVPVRRRRRAGTRCRSARG